MSKQKTNPRVTVKHYMFYFNISEKTAIKYRLDDKKYCRLKDSRNLLFSHFKAMYGEYPVPETV